MKKIIELLIDWDNEELDKDNPEFDDIGVEIMSLVDTPAIGVQWQAFSEEDIEMLNGIIDLLNEVKDIENKKQMVVSSMNGLDEDGIEYIKEDFLERLDLHQMPDGSLMEGKLEKVHSTEIMDLIENDQFGETLDIEKTVFVDFTEEKFNTITDVVQGILGLGIAGDTRATSETKYMYSGPSTSRPFCAALLRLNKAYTKPELEEMGSTVGNGIDRSEDAISVWHGGPNCRHYFNRVTITKSSTGRTVVTNEGRDSEYGIPMSSRGNLKGYRSQKTKNESLKWWWANNKFSKTELVFQTDDEKRIITGPAMKAFQMIPRKDEDGNMYHVYFSDDTIQKISEKFLRDNAHATDVNHSMESTEENTLLESWIVEDPEMDKSKSLGFEPTKGDWYVSYKINNEETWNKIKSGELNGYSIAGSFIEKRVK